MKRSLTSRAPQGYSLPEIMVTIAIVAILAGISLVSFGNVNDASRLAQAQNVASRLNGAVKGFNQGNWDLRTVKDDASTTDEFKVLRTLQYKPSSSGGRFDTGAPYYPPTWNPTASSASAEYRVRWNGLNFQLLVPGTAGLGLKLVFDGSDQAAAYAFPANYAPEAPASSN